MDPKTQEFLAFSGALLIGLVLYMMYRPKRRPSRLKLSQESGMGKANLATVPEFEEGETPDKARDLNVVFQFNGHSFDAYEVLGLPAGSGREQVEKAYNEAISSSEPESKEFLDLAYKSILQTLV